MKSYINSQVTWEDQEGKKHQTKISEEFSLDGATSRNFIAGIAPDQYFIKQGVSDQRFLDEYKVMSLLEQEQKKGNGQVNLPFFVKAQMGDDETAILMEFLKSENKMENLTFSGIEGLKTFLKGAVQALRIFSICEDLGILNQDIKPQNFYWLTDEQRLIVIDWNRCVQQDNETRSQHLMTNPSMGVFLVLFQIFTKEGLTRPFPTLDSIVPNAWKIAPRCLRRSILEASVNGAQTRKIIISFEFSLTVIEAIIQGDWDSIWTRVDSLQKEYQTEGNIDLIKDTKWILENPVVELSNENREKLDKCKDWLASIKLEEREKKKDIIAQFRKLLENGAPDECMQSIESLLQDQKQSTDFWDLLHWYAVGNLIKQVMSDPTFIDTSILPKIVDHFETVEDTDDAIKQSIYFSFIQSLDESWIDLRDIYKIAEEIDGESSPEKQLEMLRNTKELIDQLDQKNNIPKYVFEMARLRFLDYDEDDLLRQLHLEEEEKSKENELQGIFGRISSLLGVVPTPYDEIEYEINKGYSIKPPLFDRLAKVLELLRTQKYYQANALSKEGFLDPVGVDLSKVLLRNTQDWMKSVSNKVLNLSNLVQLEKLHEVGFELSPDLVLRLDIWKNARKDDLSSLCRCLENKLEPWYQPEDEDPISVVQLIEQKQNIESVDETKQLLVIEEELRQKLSDRSSNDIRKQGLKLRDLQKQAETALQTVSAQVDMVEQIDSAQETLEREITKLNEKKQELLILEHEVKQKIEENRRIEHQLNLLLQQPVIRKEFEQWVWLSILPDLQSGNYTEAKRKLDAFSPVENEDHQPDVTNPPLISTITVDNEQAIKEKEVVVEDNEEKVQDLEDDKQTIEYKEESTKPLSFIDSLRKELSILVQDDEVGADFGKWIEAIKNNDRTNIMNCTQSLNNKNTNTLYQLLLTRSSLLIADSMNFRELDDWLEMYTKREFKELRKSINQLVPETGSQSLIKMFWEEKVDQIWRYFYTRKKYPKSIRPDPNTPLWVLDFFRTMSTDPDLIEEIQ